MRISWIQIGLIICASIALGFICSGGLPDHKAKAAIAGAITYSPLPKSRLRKVADAEVVCWYIEGQDGIACWPTSKD